MKLDARRVDAFLRAPGADTRAVLLHGDDEGLVRHRAAALVRAVAGAGDDPFRTAQLGREDHDRLEEEATALSLKGGRRVVRVRDVADGLAGRLAALLPGATALLVLEAGSLPGRSKLRAWADGNPAVASIACYPEEGRALAGAVRSVLGEAGVAVDPDAVEWLSANLGSDREATRGELEKLALYCGAGERLTLEDARTCVGEQAALSLDDALFAATAGDVGQADRCLALAMAEGAAPVQVVRAAIAHLSRLHRVRLAMQPGASASEAARGARPPVFFKRVDAFAAALQRWSSTQLAAALDMLRGTELACKTTGAADTALVQHAVLAIAARRRGG